MERKTTNGNKKQKQSPKKRGKAKNKQNTSNLPRGVIQRNNMFKMSSCSRDYLKALLDPFSIPNGALPCIPDLFDAPSKKIRVQARGTLMAPGSAVDAPGFLIFAPTKGAASDRDCFWWSTAAYVTPGLPPTVATTGVLSGAFTQNPFVLADIGTDQDAKQFRLVAGAIRVRYAGTELERGGTVIPFRHPTNQPVNNYTIAQALAYNEIRKEPMTRSWHGVSFLPHTNADYQYSGTAPAATTSPGESVQSMAIMIANGSATAVKFDWEAVAYYEYTGAIFDTTASHSDVVGMSAIRTLLEGGLDGDPGTTLWNEAVNRVSKITPNDISGFASSAWAGAKAVGWVV